MEINATLIGQLITFAILVWFTMKFVWPPITKAMHEREKTIADGLNAAEQGKRALEEAEHKALTIVADAKCEANQVLVEANKRSAHLIEEAKDHAREEANRIKAQAQDEIAREVLQAKEGIRKQLVGLAVLGAEKILQRNLDAAAQSSLLDEFVAEI